MFLPTQVWCRRVSAKTEEFTSDNPQLSIPASLLAEALFLVFADERKETSAMGRKWLY